MMSTLFRDQYSKTTGTAVGWHALRIEHSDASAFATGPNTMLPSIIHAEINFHRILSAACLRSSIARSNAACKMLDKPDLANLEK